jgi:hypothetical protein
VLVCFTETEPELKTEREIANQIAANRFRFRFLFRFWFFSWFRFRLRFRLQSKSKMRLRQEGPLIKSMPMKRKRLDFLKVRCSVVTPLFSFRDKSTANETLVAGPSTGQETSPMLKRNSSFGNSFGNSYRP